MPLSIISAKPEMLVSGVFSSWLTLAVNSRRMASLSSRSLRSCWTVWASGSSSV